MLASGKIPLMVLIGPTAVGKTEVSIRLAERLDAEIISADSRLFYRGMDIGTAKPTAAQRRRAPHHLIDIAQPNETLSLAVFQQLARQAISDIHARGRLPLLVGGSGQYVHALTGAWQPPKVEPNAHLRLVLEAAGHERGKEWLHRKLRLIDPSSANLIDARNARRTVRALEVILTSGRSFSDQRVRGQPLYHTLVLGLRRPRPELYARIDARIEEMFRDGIVAETARLLDQGYSPNLPSMSAIGYSQCVRLIHGQLDLEGAKAEMRKATRAFVRRQANWFKESDPDILWLNADDPGLIRALVDHAREAFRAPGFRQSN